MRTGTQYGLEREMIMKHDVFISYSRKDQVIVDEICRLFDSNSISYWLDTKKLHMGSEFMADIVDAIENSSITLFISSSNSNNSIYTAKEVALAFNSGKYIIPYKIDNSAFSKKLQFVMTDLNCINAIPYSSQKAIELVKDIKSLLYGERHIEIKNPEKREYIDIQSWDEPQNKVLKFIKNIFADKQ